MFKVNDILEVNIEKLAFLGNGVARHSNFVVFVPNTCPGDLCKIKITKVKKNFAEAELVQVLQASTHRREPVCKVADACGGCQWQHISYEEQLKQKENIFKEICGKSKISLEGISLQILGTAANQYRYRNRVQIHHKNGQLGYLKKSSHSIVDIQDCFIAQENIASKLQDIRNLPSGRWEVYETNEGNVKTSKNRNLDFGFRQVNTHMNSKLQDLVRESLSSTNAKSVLDLYGGAGNLSIPLAQSRADIDFHVVDNSHLGINSGQKKVEKLGLKNMLFYVQDVGSYLDEKHKKADSCSVIVDPPRIGCSNKTLTGIEKLNCRQLIYISCNPTTWARDIKHLLTHTNLKIKRLELIDMFPQTYHFEVFSYLENSSN